MGSGRRNRKPSKLYTRFDGGGGGVHGGGTGHGFFKLLVHMLNIAKLEGSLLSPRTRQGEAGADGDAAV